jgi:hypothetical protein
MNRPCASMCRPICCRSSMKWRTTMNRSLDNRLERLEAGHGIGRTHCIWVHGMSQAEIEAEIARRKVAGTLDEFDKVLLLSWINPDARTA